VDTQRSKEPLSEEDIVHVFTQLLLALDHLHDRRILHRDLKTKNIFITKQNEVKLGDFGLSKMVQDSGFAQVSPLGDTKSSLGDAKSSLGDAKSSLGDAKSCVKRLGTRSLLWARRTTSARSCAKASATTTRATSGLWAACSTSSPPSSTPSTPPTCPRS
jgi:serine/threonine protein kinase